MKKANRSSVLILLLIGVLVLGMALTAFGAVYNFGKTLTSVDNDDNIANAANKNSKYGVFTSGSTYTFTDPNNVSGYRDGSLNSDTTTVTVDTTKDHGSKENPYVINSTAHWTNLVGDCNTSANAKTNTSGKFFVLATDITFSSFTPIPFFCGNFCGLNHTLTIGTYNDSSATTSQTSLSFFNGLDFGGCISDVRTKYAFTNAPFSVGGVVGRIWSGSILNCHADGSVTRTSNRSIQCFAGGIAGIAGDTNANSLNAASYKSLIYRCSSKLDASITERSSNAVNASIGGILSLIGNDAETQILDSYNYTFASINALGCNRFGGIVGLASNNGRNITIENCVARFNCGNAATAVGTGQTPSWLYASTVNLNASKFKTPSFNLKNIYVYANGTNAYSEDRWARAVMMNDGSQSNITTGTISNINIAIPGNGPYLTALDSANPTAGWYEPTYSRDSHTTKHTTSAALWNALQTSSTIPSKIWTKKSLISDTYSYTFANSPNANNATQDECKINVYNKKSSGTDELISSATYTAGTNSISPDIPTGIAGIKIFAGFVYKFNESYAARSSTLTAESGSMGFYGTIDVYAVWDVPNDSVTKNIGVSGGRDESGTYVADYDGINGITLTGNISVGSMSDYKVEYQWKKAGVNYSTAQSVNLVNVDDTGTYTLEYRIQSNSEPLWGSVSWRTVPTDNSSNDIKIKINGRSVTLRSLNLTSKAYVGMPVSSALTFNAVAEDSGGNVVEAKKWEWKTDTNPTIKEEDIYERDGKYYTKREVIFYPPNQNYAQTVLECEIPVEYLKIIFQMSGMAKDIEIDAVYGQNYTYAEVANLFEKAFLDYVGGDGSSSAIKSQTPYFNGVSINDYRKQSGYAYTNISSTQTITGNFQAVQYTFTFVCTGGIGGPQTVTENYGYGIKIVYRDDIVNVPSGYILSEWTFTDSTGNTRPWRFEAEGENPADVVTSDVTLNANLIALILTLDTIDITPTKATYPALSQLTNEDLIVVAHFTTNNASVPTYTRTLTLGGGDWGYSIQYASVGNRLHYGETVSVKYTYGTTLTVPAPIVITQISVDFTNSGFKDKSVPFGSDPSINAPTITKLPIGIKNNVTYKYYDEYGEELPNGIADMVGDASMPVSYIVEAVVETVSNDYVIDQSVTANYTVTAGAQKVEVKWDETSFVYDGNVQHPVATVYYEGTTTEVPGITVTYGRDCDKINVGNYTVSVILDSGYTIVSGETCAYAITEKIFDLPAFTGTITFNGNPQNVVLDNFDNIWMTITGDSSATDAGDYSVTVSLCDSNCKFVGGSSSVDIDWSISKAMLTVVWDMYKFEANGSVQHPNITRVDGFVAGDSFVATDFLLSGDDNVSEVGGYEITATILNSAAWAKNYQLRNPKRVFAILPEGMGNVTLITVEWDNTSFKFNDAVQHPSYVVKDMDGNVLENVEITLGGDYNSSKWAGEYKVTATAPDGYYVVQGKDCGYTITLNDEGEGTNPEENGGNNGGGGFIEKLEELINSGFPLWQICTIAAGALLTLIFMIKAIQYGNRRKKAKGEAKKISAKTYAALLPIFATEPALLFGLNNMVWSIIAFSVVGVTVLMFLIAIITRKGWKKAELAKEQAIEDSEQRKIDAEKQERREFQERMVQVGSSGGAAGGADISLIEEMRREMEERHRQEMEAMREEQAKRDEAMKLMLANLMGRQQGVDGDMPYASMDDTDLLVQKVIAGLLPAVQQMMPEPTAYLAAPSQETEELKALVEEQTETMRNMADEMQQQNAQIAELQNQLANMSHDVLDAEIISDNSEEIRALKEEHNARIDEQNAHIDEQNAQIAELQTRIDELMQGRVDAELLPDQSEEIMALTEQIEQLKSQIAENGAVVVNADNSEEIRNLEEKHAAEMQAMSAEMLAMRSQLEALSSMSVDELDDEDFDDEEEWDSILDEDDDDFVEAIIIDEGGKERKVYPNFRMRLKQSSDKNREWYAVIKNLFCSQKGVTYRVYKRVEKIRYQGQVIAVIGIAKRSIKLWLALKPYEYDARRYHHKDVSDKPRFVDVPMYVRVSSDRALDRSQELILALFQELNMEARKRYTDRPIQELIFTLKHNRLLTNKQNKQLLCEVMHVHDCDVLDDETAEKCIEFKNVESLDESNIETVKLDDIDAKFQDGNRVTLDRLKKVGLVSEDCTGFTVTADKRLTKPLIIVANDFTLTAVKLIALTGGRAIKLQTV